MAFVVHKVPTAVAGLALALASLGLLFERVFSLQGIVQSLTAGIALVLIGLVLIKFFSQPTLLVAELKHPVAGALLPVVTMALMVVANGLFAFSEVVAGVLVQLALLVQLFLFGAFLYYRSQSVQLAQFIPPWFIPPIGLVLYVVVAPVLVPIWLQASILYASLVAYAVLLPIVLWRVTRLPMAVEAKPVLTILATPASLILLGLLLSDLTVQPILLYAVFAIAQVMTLSVYCLLPKLLRLPFTPAFSAFTFPLVVSATVLFNFQEFLSAQAAKPWLICVVNTMAYFELFVATAVLVYVSGCFGYSWFKAMHAASVRSS